MRGVPIAAFVPSLILCSLLVLVEVRTHEPASDNVGPESNSWLTEQDKLEPRLSRGKARAIEFTQDRLKADGFLEDKHSQSALEHDLTNKLRAIYERYYELSDKLQQAEGNSGELTKQLMQTKLDLANYKVYKNDLINRLKKTEMYLTVLWMKSQYHVEEHHIDLNPDLYEEEANEIARVAEPEEKQVVESRTAAVTNDNDKKVVKAKETPKVDTKMILPETVNVKANVDTTSHVLSGEVGEMERKTNMSGDSETPNMETSGVTETVVLSSQGNQTINNATTNEDVLAEIAFNFLRKKPSKPKTPEGPTLRGGFFDSFTEDVVKGPTGPVVKNVTVVLRGAPKRKNVKGVSLTDWDFGSDLDNMNFRLFESNSADRHNTNYEHRRGAPGAAGRPGVPGNPGSSGPAGAAGTNGPAGLAGPAGQKGEPGRGVSGVNGINGVQGVQGATGLTGPTGISGPNGATGLKGVVGVQGPRGAQGIKGGVGAPGG